ncbi:MAG: phosphoesterase [Cytophagales bacterium]|nr:phosphoesterase [Armatimonadota bacterium]
MNQDKAQNETQDRTQDRTQGYDEARRFLTGLPPGARLAISYHGDADGSGSAALAAAFLERTGRIVAVATAPRKGEDLFGEAYRERLLAARPDALLVLDHGSRPERVLEGVPTLVVDHHDVPPEGVPAEGYLSGLNESPTPTAALMTWRLLSPLADLSDIGWLGAVGMIGDLGSDAPFPELVSAKKQWGQKHLTETVALVNAAKRSGAHDTDTSLRALRTAVAPREIATGMVPEYDLLTEYRAEVQAERMRCAKTAPRFAGDWALLRFSSPCQIHGPLASSWVGRLPRHLVLAANDGYTPGNVHFSVRTRRPDENLLTRLRAFRADLGVPELGQGHAEATGGVLPVATFEKLLGLLGF